MGWKEEGAKESGWKVRGVMDGYYHKAVGLLLNANGRWIFLQTFRHLAVYNFAQQRIIYTNQSEQAKKLRKRRANGFLLTSL